MPFEPGGFQRRPEPLVHQPPAERLAGLGMAEHEAVGVRVDDVGLVGAQQQLELAGDDVGHRNRPLRAPGLRGRERLRLAVPRPAHADAGVHEVDAAPVERLQLADPQSGQAAVKYSARSSGWK